ncbi:MAG: hypothetical protein KIT16_21990 [Rhodospirillaceae bacterium]|nr:hypothetical protein [Rhodospirillaceae bacterium]
MSGGKASSDDELRQRLGAPLSSPRAYFGRASRATTGPLRPAGDDSGAEAEPLQVEARPPVYRAGDPALRVFSRLRLPVSPTVPLTGAVVVLSGVRDGTRERLLVDLGTTLVRSSPQRDEAAGTFTLTLGRTQSAETYRGLLASLRYVNEAPAPTPGSRQVRLDIVDATGASQSIEAVQVHVGALPAADENHDGPITLGEAVRFNVEGDYTLFWWPRLLSAAGERARPARAPEGAPAPASSYFSGGGQVYRLFDPQPPAPPHAALAPSAPPPSAPTPSAYPRAANDASGRTPAPVGREEQVWTPEHGEPPPGFERARMLRLEDVFGSDMQDALTRRLLEQRLAAGA